VPRLRPRLLVRGRPDGAAGQLQGRPRGTAISGWEGRLSAAALALSASLSQRSPKVRRSAASSGELANFARRAHSAAWAWQYFTYDITRSQHSAQGALAVPASHSSPRP